MTFANNDDTRPGAPPATRPAYVYSRAPADYALQAVFRPAAAGNDNTRAKL